jgi:hypothetical protein
MVEVKNEGICCNRFLIPSIEGHDDFRSIVIENSIFPHVNGSSRVRIPGAVDVLCSVKVSVCLTCRNVVTRFHSRHHYR